MKPSIIPIQRRALSGSVSRQALIRGMTNTSQVGMQQGDRAYSFDANLLLSDNAAAYTADGYSQVAGADAVLDLGGNQGTTPLQQARIDAMCVIDVTAIDIASGNETYVLRILGCNLSSFASGVVELAAITLGKGASLVPATQADSVVGRYELPFCTEQANAKYQYVKMYVDTGGTSPSISFQAFVAVLPEA